MPRFASVLVFLSLAGAFLFEGPTGAETPRDVFAAPGSAETGAPVPPAPAGAVSGSLSAVDPARAGGAPGEVLVVGRTPAAGKPGLAPVSGLEAPAALREMAGRRRVAITRLEPLARSRAARDLFPGGAWVLRYEGGEDPETVAARLREDPAVAYAGPNHLFAVTAASRAPAAEDPLFDQQYGLALVNAPAAWETSRGEGVLVAVIDTGVDVTHPDLAARIEVNEAERDGIAGVDDDGNGYVDDVMGYDFTDAPDLPGVGDYRDADPDPADEFGHGTQVAGVIAAVEGNGIGVAGIAPEARILAVRAGFNTGLPFLPALLQEDDAAEAILYAVDRGARILNLSWGDLVEAPLLGEAVRYARERGALVVAGSGNDPGDLAFYPAAYAGVVSAGACDEQAVRANFTTYGQDLDLLAPGVGLWTTSPGGTYDERTGTSFSSPMVAGAAALVWSRHPEWTADQVAWRLRLSARRETEGWTAGRGWGVLDAAAAVTADEAPPVVQVESARLGEVLFGKTDPGELLDSAVAGAASVAFEPAAFPHLVIHGTVAATRLSRWTLSVLPDSVADQIADVGSEALGETVLVRSETRQVRAESLAVFVPRAGAADAWVARLRAWTGGGPVIEKRLRFNLGVAQPDTSEMAVELQVARDRGWDPLDRGGWDVVATWSSDLSYRGSLRLVTGGTGDYAAEEVSSGTHHAVRLAGPLPPGEASLEVWGRTADGQSPRRLAVRPLTIPAAELGFDAVDAGDLPPGTPMARSADWDGDHLPEVFLEAPPASGSLYGDVLRYELGPPSLSFIPPTRLDSSAGHYQGIPVDVADGDGDGLLELVVFRLDGWSIYEEDVGGGEVPIRQVFHQGPDTPVPVAFTKTGVGTVLVAISGGGLSVFALDAEENWGFASHAPASDVSLQHGGVLADFDGDGITDAFFADAYGRLFWFTIDGATVRYQHQVGVGDPAAAPAPVAGAMLAVPGEGGRLDLLTTELDPLTPEVEGDLDRAAVRMRRWSWNGSSLTERASLAFGGLTGAGRLRLQKWRGQALLSRGSILDLVMLADGGLQAGGGLPASRSLSRVDGAAVTIAPAGFTDLLWRGNARAEDPGERVMITSRLDAGEENRITGAPPLRVVWAAVDEESLRLELAWDANGCADPGMLTRYDPDGSLVGIPVADGRASTRVPLGDEEVVFHLERAPCVGRTLAVTPRAPQRPAPRWDGPQRLVMDFDVPLRQVPGQTLLLRGSQTRVPTAVYLDRSGRRLLVPVGETVPDSLRLDGAWDENGLPLGGRESWTVAVPSPPDPAVVPVLAQVSYALQNAQFLEVTVSGGAWAPSCDKPFRLEPVGWDLAAHPAPGGPDASPPSLPGAESQAFVLPLPERLPAGIYTLSLTSDCLAPEQRGPGQDRQFRVGILVYPNPLTRGERLNLENLEPGSRVSLVDVSGREVRAWRASHDIEGYALEDIAPGLYFLRLEDFKGRLLTHHKILILR